MHTPGVRQEVQAVILRILILVQMIARILSVGFTRWWICNGGQRRWL